MGSFAFRTFYCDLAFYSTVVLKNKTQLSHPQRIVLTNSGFCRIRDFVHSGFFAMRNFVRSGFCPFGILHRIKISIITFAFIIHFFSKLEKVLTYCEDEKVMTLY